MGILVAANTSPDAGKPMAGEHDRSHRAREREGSIVYGKANLPTLEQTQELAGAVRRACLVELFTPASNGLLGSAMLCDFTFLARKTMFWLTHCSLACRLLISLPGRV